MYYVFQNEIDFTMVLLGVVDFQRNKITFYTLMYYVLENCMS